MADVGIARLIQSRTDRIVAEVGPGAKLGGGGSLKAKVRARVQEADDKDQAFAEVFIRAYRHSGEVKEGIRFCVQDCAA